MKSLHFGNKMQELRRAVNVSRRELAEKIKVSESLVYRYEAGKTLPSIAKAAAMAVVFGVSLDDLVDGVKFAETHKRGARSKYNNNSKRKQRG